MGGSQDCDGSVREADAEIGVALYERTGLFNVMGRERLELVRAPCNLGEQLHARRFPDTAGEQVIELREHERREQQRRLRSEQAGRGFLVVAFGGVQRGQQAAGVEQDHSPKPAASSSSTRSASVGSPLSNSGTLGGGCT